MSERPIIFSTEMVKTILEERKTMTRRVIKPKSEGVLLRNSDIVEDCHTKHRGRFMLSIWTPWNSKTPIPLMIKCPYGQVGELWVRETWFGVNKGEPIEYKASLEPHQAKTRTWKSSLFMPRWASRITLEITGIRVERLQEITDKDAEAEGFRTDKSKTWWQGYRELDLGELGKELMHQQATGSKPPDWMIEPHRMLDRPDIEAIFSAKNNFRVYWNSLNAKRGYGWDTNPWVWVIEFKKV